MNYLKTKTIQKQRIIIRSGLLSSLLLFLVSCSSGSHSDAGSNHALPNYDSIAERNKAIHAEIMNKVGGIGPCGRPCLESALIELAITNNKTTTVEGTESWLIPKKTSDNIPILQSITNERIIGNAEGKKKWVMWMRLQRKKGIQVKEGLHGKAGDMLKILADSRQRHRDPVIYAAISVMGLKTSLEEGGPSKANITEALRVFEEGISYVAPGKNGVRVLIKKNENPVLEFIYLQEKKKSKKKDRYYLLPEATYNSLMSKYEELKKEVLQEADKFTS